MAKAKKGNREVVVEVYNQQGNLDSGSSKKYVEATHEGPLSFDDSVKAYAKKREAEGNTVKVHTSGSKDEE